MAKGKQGKQVSFSAAAGPSTTEPDNAYRGFQPDATLREVSLDEPKLDCSPQALGQDKELWLIQLPLDMPSSKRVTWAVDRAAPEAFRAHCTVDGSSYEMIVERELTNVPVWAAPKGSSGKLARVDRRLTVLRNTDAPAVCFGQQQQQQQQHEAQQAQQASAAAKKLGKKHKKKGQEGEGKGLQPAAAAPVISQPREAVPAAAVVAAPTKSGVMAPGNAAEQQGQQQRQQQQGQQAAGGGAAAAGAAEEKKSSKKKKRKAEEGGEAAAEAKGSEKKAKKKDKSKKSKGRE